VTFVICQVYKSRSTDWHPTWKQPIFFCQISLHSNLCQHLQLLNWLPTQSWVPTLPSYQDYWRYWPPMCITSDSRTIQCSNRPRYTLRKSILHYWISNWDAYPKWRRTHPTYHLWLRQSPYHLQ
jgi:hypothetical protein